MTNPETKTPLKIEAGKTYTTRDGKKAHVLCEHPSNGKWPFLGAIDGVHGVYSWAHTGLQCAGSTTSSDLISEYKEPRVWEICVVVNADGNPEIVGWSNGSCGVDAPRNPGEKAIGTLTLKEGEGL